MKRQRQQEQPKRFEVREADEYGTTVYKVWDTQTDTYVYGTCEYEWAWQECNVLNNTTR
jgi:hypothetical protein